MAEDWPEGQPQWWWKYVYPARDLFWSQLLAANLGPVPDPWLQSFTADVLEGVAMIRASGVQNDPEIRARLKEEGLKKISHATHVAHGAKAA